MRRITVSLLALFAVALSWFSCIVSAEPIHPITYTEFVNLMQLQWNFNGEQHSGVSRESLRAKFKGLMKDKVNSFVAKDVGGSIEEFGEKRWWPKNVCPNPPALTMGDVINLAQQSFNITGFEPSIPPCDNGGKVMQCNYDTGSCCQRPQVEFVGRYYDTAVAAMALGATKEEAFAPLIHARALAFTLQACDPDINYKGTFEPNKIEFALKWSNGVHATGIWNGGGLSLISFPQSYEVLYELYNSMLIERLKSRRMTSFPSHTQMEALQSQVYYKKLLTRCVRLGLELRDDLAFPSSGDFTTAGLTIVTSSRIQTMRLLSVNNSEGMPSTNVYINPTLRSSLEPVSVYEEKSQARQYVDLTKCNSQLPYEGFFQFKVMDTVWDKHEACCAVECDFLARYGGTFSSGSANCCAGCNRYSCTANTAEIVNLLAESGIVESPWKSNAGLSEVTLTV